jgi:hypothetical protein
MDRRMEDRIRKLCAEVIAESDPERARELSRELRMELHDFIAELRARVSSYPVVADRRAQTGVPPPESVSETTSASLREGAAAAKAPIRQGSPSIPNS